MTWLIFKTSAKKTWAWLRHNWKIPFLAAWSVIIFLMSRRNTEALKDVIESNKQAHREEVEAINKIHKQQIIKLKNLQEQYEETISRLEKQFEKENRELSEKHVEDVKEIVIESKGNPEKIIRKIENDFGIKFKN